MIMLTTGYWELNGKKRRPKGLVFTKKGDLDQRYSINKGWRWRDPVIERYMSKMAEYVLKPSVLVNRLLSR